VESPRTLVHVSRPQEQDPEGRPPFATTASHASEPARRRIVRKGGQPAADELVLDRYRLLEQLGSGGFGVVWRARDELLHREVAVKRVWLGAGDGPIDSERASREALAAARLSHPAIVALHEACAHDGAFYMISELVDGATLAQLIREDALEDEEILAIGLALTGALAHAHARGVIHRDIKPQNVLVPYLPADGEGPPQTPLVAAKLTDFGGASLVGEQALTRTGDVIGTLAYMAPEQSEGREVGADADLYSLALVLYEALCGENPVRGPTPAATARRIGRPLPPLERARADLSPRVARALDLALAPDPHERGTLDQLREALTPTGTPDGAVRQRRPVAEHAPRAHTPAGVRAGAGLYPDRAPRDRDTHEHELAAPPASDRPRGFALPRQVWLACALALVGWQALAGRAGVALLVFAALLPLLVLPRERHGSRVGAGWLAAALAPVLGWVGLAGAFPALAGQRARWVERAALAALGYWWLSLAAPLLGRDLWLAPAPAPPSRAAWEGSVSTTATHVIGPLLGLGLLLGALLWALGAAVLPWLVRGRRAALDVVAVTVWSAAIVAAAPALDSGLGAATPHPSPRGAVLGAVLGALLAVAARALRGPV
jgi:eukaryotic-like serine/threonine-protein kinase